MRWIGLALLASSLAACKAKPAEPVRVAAAADLAHAFDELTPGFEASTSVPLKLTLGASGLLAKQIAQGAPFDVFLAANTGYVNDVVKAGACDGATRASYATGRLVIWTKAGDGKGLTPSSLNDARFTHIAIANPEHAPYGKAAREALTKAGVWDAISARLVYGENVQQTFELAKSGNADVAIVGLSLALGAKLGTWAFVDPALYTPLEQSLVVCNRGSNREAGARLAAYLTSARGREILKKYGFLLPGEQLTQAP